LSSYATPTLSRRGALLGAGAAAFTLVSGCGSQPKRGTAKAPDQVTYLTGFGAAGREAHAWVAEAKGFFATAGLKVTIGLGAPETNVKSTVAGQAQFAAVDASGELIRHSPSASAPAGTRIVGAIQPRTVVSLMSLQGYGINSARDLAGRTVGVATGAVPKTLFPGYAKLANVDPASVKFLNAQPSELPGLLLTHRVDAVGLFVAGAAGLEKAAGGRKVVILPYDEFLSDLMGTVIVTPTALPDSNPDLVRRFMGALMQGLKYTLDHPDEAGDILKRAQPTQDAKLAAREVALMDPYCRPERGQQFGVIDSVRVARSIASLEGTGLLTGPLTPQDVIAFGMLGNAPKVA
jgi:NitT/TauT family transport system substrate-binding protein